MLSENKYDNFNMIKKLFLYVFTHVHAQTNHMRFSEY